MSQPTRKSVRVRKRANVSPVESTRSLESKSKTSPTSEKKSQRQRQPSRRRHGRRDSDNRSAAEAATTALAMEEPVDVTIASSGLANGRKSKRQCVSVSETDANDGRTNETRSLDLVNEDGDHSVERSTTLALAEIDRSGGGDGDGELQNGFNMTARSPRPHEVVDVFNHSSGESEETNNTPAPTEFMSGLSALRSRLEKSERMLKEAENVLAGIKHRIYCEADTKRTGSDNIVSINVGGTIFTSRKSTLEQANGTNLGELINGRSEAEVDESGYVYIDRNPKHFQYILNWLRDPEAPQAHPDDFDFDGLHHELLFFGIDMSNLLKSKMES